MLERTSITTNTSTSTSPTPINNQNVNTNNNQVNVTISKDLIGELDKKEPSSTAGSSFPVLKVTVQPQAVNLKSGETASLQAQVKMQDLSVNDRVQWQSSKPEIVSVNHGELKALQPGKAVITAQASDDSGVLARVGVAVNADEGDNKSSDAVISMVQISPIAKAVTTSEFLELKALVVYSDGSLGDALEWKSENEDVATVNEAGQVFGVKPGQARIIATAKDDPGVRSAAAIVIVPDGQPTTEEVLFGALGVTVNVTVKTPLFASLETEKPVIQIGEIFAVLVRDIQGNPISYRYEFGDRSPSQELAVPVVTHTYRQPGRYEIKLTLTDDLGEIWQDSVFITVTEK